MDPADRQVVAVQLGRSPRGETSVAARCVHGLPAVVRTEPILDDGEPFPTLYWLTCPAAVRAVGRLESEGLMRSLNERLASDRSFAAAYARAHEAYVADRDSPTAPSGASPALPGAPGAGGMPDRVKCLHALYAHELGAGGNPVGSVVRDEIEPLDCPGQCVIMRDGSAEPAPGHPHMRHR